jgi:ribosomal protein S18 acetylase RimI-like enzyme
MRIRAGRPSDSAAVAAVCLATAAAGDPLPPDAPQADVVAAVYAESYLALEPRTARVLLDGDRAVGYVVGAVDSPAFYQRWRREWSPRFPPPQPGDPAPVRDLARLLAEPERMLPAEATDYPSHLHINLLPAARGGGWGGRLMEDFLEGLRRAGSPGAHLGVDPANTAAARFYARCGFTRARRRAGTDIWVRGLEPLTGDG